MELEAPLDERPARTDAAHPVVKAWVAQAWRVLGIETFAVVGLEGLSPGLGELADDLPCAERVRLFEPLQKHGADFAWEPQQDEEGRARPAAAARSRISGSWSSLSPGMMGPRLTLVGTPASERIRSVSKRL